MNIKCGQSILPHPLKLYEGQFFTFSDTVNYLQAETFIPALGKVFAQFRASVFYFLSMSPMPDMHAVDGLACVLYATLVTGYQVDTIFRLACQVVSNSVAQPSKITVKISSFFQPWAKHATSTPAPMLVFVAARDGLVTDIIKGQFL